MTTVQRVKKLYETGMGIAAIARECGISRPTVYKYIAMEEECQPVIGRPSKRRQQIRNYDSDGLNAGSEIDLIVAICEQAHSDQDHDWLQPIQEDALIYIENKANDHVKHWISRRARRST